VRRFHDFILAPAPLASRLDKAVNSSSPRSSGRNAAGVHRKVTPELAAFQLKSTCHLIERPRFGDDATVRYGGTHVAPVAGGLSGHEVNSSAG
jgi:hypothetical protein